MRCKKVMERLDDHVDGLLAAPEAEAIRDHLDLCTECRETSLAMKAASASLATWNDAEPPAACFDKILARIDAIPAEALLPPAPRAFFSRLPRFETVRAARVRWFATSGLAAAASVLAMVNLSRTEAHAVRRVAREQPAAAPSTSASWLQGYDFDDGLFRQRATRPYLPAGSRFELFESSPR